MALIFMPCREATALLTDYKEGRVTGLTKAKLEFHLKICSGCTCYRQQLDATIDALGALPREAPPDELEEKLWAELKKDEPGG
jgi:predicted anti-sigma-YlaC factor YlaD